MYENKYAELKEKADNSHSRWNKGLVTGHSFKTDCFSGGRRNISIGNQRWNSQKSFYESPRLFCHLAFYSCGCYLFQTPVFFLPKLRARIGLPFYTFVYISIQAFYFVLLKIRLLTKYLIVM
jgi:hypothetical protein